MAGLHPWLGVAVIAVCAAPAPVEDSADERRAGDELHYAYGSLALGVALAPWFYAPEGGPRRLLWFAGTTAVAGALGVRAYMTGAG